jgi:hypothetical protein
MPATQAAIGYGSKFQVVDPSISPDTFVDLGEVINIGPPTRDLDIIDATHMQSPNRTREFILGLIDPGEANVEMNYVPGGTTDDMLVAIEAAAVAVNCRIVFPNGVNWTFLALLQSRDFDITVDDKMTHTATWKVTGSTTIGQET